MIIIVLKKIGILVTVIGLCAASCVWADYNEEEAKRMEEEMQKLGFKTMTTKEGLNFNIPADMPVVTRNGLTAPVNFDEYLYVKYRQQQEELKKMDVKIDTLSSKLDKILKYIESVEAKAAQSAAEQAVAAPASAS